MDVLELYVPLDVVRLEAVLREAVNVWYLSKNVMAVMAVFRTYLVQLSSVSKLPLHTERG